MSDYRLSTLVAYLPPERCNQIVHKGNPLRTDILIEVLASIAEQERVRTLQCQAQGIATAKEKGKHLGRPPVQFPDGWDEIYGKWKLGEVTATEAMTRLGLKRSTFYKLVHTQ